MAAGVTQDDEANLAAAKAFVSHLIETVDPEEFDEVFGVICSPSHVSFTDKSNLVATLRGQVNAIMVVTEPFATAFAIDEIGGSIVVDVGAGTTDIARIHGTFPSDEDQVTIQEAGDWLDLELMNLIAKKFQRLQMLSSELLLKQILNINPFYETTSSSQEEVRLSKGSLTELPEKSLILGMSMYGVLKTHWKRSLRALSCSQVKCLMTCTPPSTDLVEEIHSKIRRFKP